MWIVVRLLPPAWCSYQWLKECVTLPTHYSGDSVHTMVLSLKVPQQAQLRVGLNLSVVHRSWAVWHVNVTPCLQYVQRDASRCFTGTRPAAAAAPRPGPAVCAHARVASQLWGEWGIFSTVVSSTWASSGQDQQPDQATQRIPDPDCLLLF